MKGGRDIRPFIAHRVTESQSHTTSTPYTVGENFLCPFLINSPTGFARRGIIAKEITYNIWGTLHIARQQQKQRNKVFNGAALK
jgi:hypothetical protein